MKQLHILWKRVKQKCLTLKHFYNLETINKLLRNQALHHMLKVATISCL